MCTQFRERERELAFRPEKMLNLTHNAVARVRLCATP